MTLVVEHVTKEYRGGVRANDDISLEIRAGEVFGLLGPNGAGKTTLVGQVIGLVAPTSGRILIDGVDVVADPAFARKACSYQPQSQVPINGLTPVQAIEYVGRIRGGDKASVRQRTAELIDALQMDEWAGRPAHQLSGGTRRLVAFAMAAVHPGKVVILDEPTNDVDPLRRRLLWHVVRELAGAGSAVLLVSHNVLEAERAVDRLAVMHHGRTVAAGTPAAIKGGLAGRFRIEVVLEPAAPAPERPAWLLVPVVAGRRIVAELERGHAGQALLWAEGLYGAGVAEEFSIGPSTLEDAYVRLVGPEAPADE